MAGAPKGNKNAKGNKGGTPTSKYHKSFSGVAKKLCELGATNADLAIAFDVVLATIWNWQVCHVEFNESCKVGIVQSLSPFRDLPGNVACGSTAADPFSLRTDLCLLLSKSDQNGASLRTQRCANSVAILRDRPSFPRGRRLFEGVVMAKHEHGDHGHNRKRSNQQQPAGEAAGRVLDPAHGIGPEEAREIAD